MRDSSELDRADKLLKNKVYRVGLLPLANGLTAENKRKASNNKSSSKLLGACAKRQTSLKTSDSRRVTKCALPDKSEKLNGRKRTRELSASSPRLPWINSGTAATAARRERENLEQLRNRQHILRQCGKEQLELFSKNRDAALLARLERAGLGRWQKIVALGADGVGEVRRLETSLITSRATSSRIGRSAFANLILSQTQKQREVASPTNQNHGRTGAAHVRKGNSGGKAKDFHCTSSKALLGVTSALEAFEAISAFQYYRNGVIVHDMDEMDARELVVACKLLLPNRKSAVQRLCGELFDLCLQGTNDHLDRDALRMLLTVGVESKVRLHHIEVRFKKAWEEFVPLSDRIRLRISRMDLKALLQHGLWDFFQIGALCNETDQLESDNDSARENCGFEKLHAPPLLCAWEYMFLPSAVYEKLLIFRRGIGVEEQFVVNSARRRVTYLRHFLSRWSDAASARKVLRRGQARLLLSWKHATQQRALLRLWSFAVRDVAALKVNNFCRQALVILRQWRIDDKHAAAVMIQANIRSYFAKVRWQKTSLRRTNAAAIVQRFYRGRSLARQTKLRRYRELRHQWHTEQDRAAVRIQALFRQYLAKLRAISRRNEYEFEQQTLRKQRETVARMLFDE